eukprot:scaffold167376_cov82-Cyclotella_meneghiniana.AAC.1
MSQFCHEKGISSKFNLVLIPLFISLVYQRKFGFPAAVFFLERLLIWVLGVECSLFTRVHKLLSVQIMKAETADRAESGT